jgi:glycosyltransferase involved in cell wall biosynthesis
MKFLFVSNLFPDTREPARGLFNARLVKYLGRLHEVRVISPRPAPGWLRRGGGRTARPEDEKFFPVFPPTGYLPKIGDRWNHLLMAGGLRGPLEQTQKEFPFQAILAAWAYPDCCAVARLAGKLRVPFVALVQGSDAHQYLGMPVRRRIIVESLNTAAAVVAQSLELQRLLREAGVKPDKLRTIYNGVEQDVFKPGDRTAARAGLNLPAGDIILLYVGNLLPVKNPLLLVEAHARLLKQNPGRAFRLVMIGTGPLREEIQRRSRQLGTGALVSLTGGLPPAVVARHMQAADLVCIPSDNEGLPNVLNEAFSCGRRVVATRVGGIPEVLNGDYLGRMVERRSAAALAGAIELTLAGPEEPDPIARHAAQYSWENCAGQHARLLENAAQGIHDE